MFIKFFMMFQFDLMVKNVVENLKKEDFQRLIAGVGALCGTVTAVITGCYTFLSNESNRKQQQREHSQRTSAASAEERRREKEANERAKRAEEKHLAELQLIKAQTDALNADFQAEEDPNEKIRKAHELLQFLERLANSSVFSRGLPGGRDISVQVQGALPSSEMSAQAFDEDIWSQLSIEFVEDVVEADIIPDIKQATPSSVLQLPANIAEQAEEIVEGLETLPALSVYLVKEMHLRVTEKRGTYMQMKQSYKDIVGFYRMMYLYTACLQKKRFTKYVALDFIFNASFNIQLVDPAIARGQHGYRLFAGKRYNTLAELFDRVCIMRPGSSYRSYASIQQSIAYSGDTLPALLVYYIWLDSNPEQVKLQCNAIEAHVYYLYAVAKLQNTQRKTKILAEYLAYKHAVLN